VDVLEELHTSIVGKIIITLSWGREQQFPPKPHNSSARPQDVTLGM